MTKLSESKLIRDLKSIPSPIFYVFAAVVLCCSIFICGFTVRGILTGIFLMLLTACASSDIKDGIVPDFVHILIVVLAFFNIMSSQNNDIPKHYFCYDYGTPDWSSYCVCSNADNCIDY